MKTKSRLLDENHNETLAIVDNVFGEATFKLFIDKDFLSKLQREIDKHILESDFSITNLSEMMFMSRSNFYRKIKSISGMTPSDYLKVIRLNKAAELLRQDDVRIVDVYEQVGFSSSSYFAKCFKAQFGILPKAYMKNVGREGAGAGNHGN